jgi:hypothetical protein
MISEGSTKKWLGLFLCALFVLAACTLKTGTPQPTSIISEVKPITSSPLSDLPGIFPIIERKPEPWNWDAGKLIYVPTYDPNSVGGGEMDFRANDLSELDLSNSLDDLLYASFDDRTIWPAEEKMPPDYDWKKIMELGKNPGLGIRQLHQAGITGRGVGIAIIDQTLLVEHLEYINQLRLYEEADDLTSGWENVSMHGPAVASIAVGKTVGVAPDADLYFIATSFCNYTGSIEDTDFSCLAKQVRRILEINELLPQDRKIRVLSISIGWGPESIGYAEINAATKEAKDAGMLVICSSVEEVHGFKFHALGRKPFADPDQFESYEPGLWWAQQFYDGKQFSDRLLVPMDSRTTASPGGVDEYVFYREGGWSWSIPYIAGAYALAAQVKPTITPDEFWQLALQTGRTIELHHERKVYEFGVILDPIALVIELQK